MILKQSLTVFTVIGSIIAIIILTVLIFNPSKEYLIALEYKYIENNNCYIIVKRTDNGNYERIKTTIFQYENIDYCQTLYVISTQGLTQKVLYTYEVQFSE